MADIFLSYARPDQARAKRIVDALVARGWDVWWDVKLTPGTRFRKRTAEQLAAARCVVVLWSKASITSDWVIDEAEDGRRRGVLVQALIEEVLPPHGFRQIQTAALSEWNGSDTREFEQFCAGISAHTSPPTIPPSPPINKPFRLRLSSRVIRRGLIAGIVGLVTLSFLPKSFLEKALEIFANPEPNFRVDLSLNRQSLVAGEELKITVQASSDSYVHLFGIDSQGIVTVLFPNRYRRNNFIKAREVLAFPSPDDRFDLKPVLPPNLTEVQEMVSVVATRQKIDLVGSDFKEADRVYGTGDSGVYQSLMQKLDRLSKADWTQETASYRIRKP
jgi:hypothetical protein